MNKRVGTKRISYDTQWKADCYCMTIAVCFDGGFLNLAHENVFLADVQLQRERDYMSCPIYWGFILAGLYCSPRAAPSFPCFLWPHPQGLVVAKENFGSGIGFSLLMSQPSRHLTSYSVFVAVQPAPRHFVEAVDLDCWQSISIPRSRYSLVASAYTTYEL